MKKILKFIKYYFFFFSLVLVSIPTHSQTFEQLYYTSFDDEGRDAIELPNGNFLIVINKGNFLTSYYDFILLTINNSGSIVDSLIYNGSNNYNYFGVREFFNLNDSVYVCFRVCEDVEQNYYLNFIKFDNQFNVLLDTVVGETIPELYLFYEQLTQDDKIVITATETINKEFFIYEFDLVQNELFYHPIIDTGGIINHWPMVIYDIPEKNKYIVYMFDAFKSIHEINKTDYTIDTSYTYSSLGFFMPIDAIHGFNDNSNLVAGRMAYVTPTEARFTPAYFTINHEGNILDFHNYDMQNDTSSKFWPHCSAIANNKLYLALTYNYTNVIPFIIIPEQRWIWLMCINSDGSLDWQHFYKGDVNYMPYKLLPTSDKGFLIVSNKYDWNDPIPNQRDVHILKVDSTGWYQGMPIGSTEFEKPKQILVYPNPVKDQVNFVLGYYKDLNLEIYNSNGTKVLNGNIEHTMTFDLAHLTKGLYVYILSGKYGFVEKGKLVKQ